MKTFVVAFIVAFSLNLSAETPDSHTTDKSKEIAPVVKTDVPEVSKDKSQLLFQYISACMVTRPAGNTEDILKQFVK